jgi:hypothetical protein
VIGFVQEFSDFNIRSVLRNSMLSGVLSAYFPAPLPFGFMDTGGARAWRLGGFGLMN